MQSRLITRIAPDVGWLPVSFTNVYFIGRPGGKWIVVDTGFPGRAREILAAAEARAQVAETHREQEPRQRPTPLERMKCARQRPRDPESLWREKRT